MRFDDRHIKVAVQRRGRLAAGSLSLLQSAGLRFEDYSGRLFSHCSNFPLDILFLRDDDIPEYVQDGVAHLGIVGLNVATEKGVRVRQLERLGFGKCTLSIAVLRDSGYRSVRDLEGRRIATSYPRTLGSYLKEKKLNARIVEISGSVEIAPGLDVADAVCDLVSTGSTLMMNGLEPIETVLESEAVLLANHQCWEDPGRQKLISRLLVRLQSHLSARRTRYVMLNAPRQSLPAIRSILPGMHSPTVLPLAEADMIAVHTAVPEEIFWEVVEKLKGAGARDILVLPVEQIVP